MHPDHRRVSHISPVPLFNLIQDLCARLGPVCFAHSPFTAATNRSMNDADVSGLVCLRGESLYSWSRFAMIFERSAITFANSAVTLRSRLCSVCGPDGLADSSAGMNSVSP